MFNQRTYRALGIAIPSITAALLLKLTGMFDIGVETNLFNTGITPALLFGALNVALAIAIYKNRV